jgi:pyrroline-5-carboxylate reductase
VKVTEQQLEACARIKHQEPAFVAMLQERLAKTQKDANMQRDVVSLRWAQGRVQELEDLLQLVENATNHLRKA